MNVKDGTKQTVVTVKMFQIILNVDFLNKKSIFILLLEKKPL
jgi:hypothetical protein